ncbi:MAG: ABC transporter ATP-binding protein [Chloroflexi bacterium]|nr:ABC transporter ATP-binding protein [Chloroflexota bacterium]
MFAIETRNLSKKSKTVVAVDNVDMVVEEGECFGLLGPNGAGKTSLIRMITGMSPPAAGEVRVMGMDLRTHARQIKATIGVMPQIDNPDPDLSVLQNLITFARYFDISYKVAKQRSLELLRLFGLEGKSGAQIRELSGGMKRRLLLARSLLNQPRIIILDEPTIGLDPQSKYLVWKKLRELKSQGVTQLLSTQNMEEAAALADRVAIMNLGRFLDIDTPKELIRRHVGSDIWEIDVTAEEDARITKELKELQMEFESNDRIYVFHISDEKLLGKTSIPSGKLKRRTATLEDVFLRLTGRSLTE